MLYSKIYNINLLCIILIYKLLTNNYDTLNLIEHKRNCIDWYYHVINL